MKSLTLEHTDNNAFRALVFQTLANGNTTVADIAESSSLAELNEWVVEEHPDIIGVRIRNSVDVPDCLTPFEAAEAAMAPLS